MRLINADALFTELWKNTEWYDNQDREIALDKALDAPTIDAEPVRHGRWNRSLHHQFPVCSECCFTDSAKHKFCPQCGAKMGAKEGKANE